MHSDRVVTGLVQVHWLRAVIHWNFGVVQFPGRWLVCNFATLASVTFVVHFAVDCNKVYRDLRD